VGPDYQRRGVKEKEEGKWWAGAGVGWAAWAERSRCGFSFFFKLHFQIIFHVKFNSNFFKLFSRIFIDFLETT
jgi:hypothetical protein